MPKTHQDGLAGTSEILFQKVPQSEGKKRVQRRCKICSEKRRKHSDKGTRRDIPYQSSECKIIISEDPCSKFSLKKKSYKLILVIDLISFCV